MAQPRATTTTNRNTAAAKAKKAEQDRLAAEAAKQAEAEAAALAEKEVVTQPADSETKTDVEADTGVKAEDAPEPEVKVTTLAEAQQKQLDENILVKPAAKTIAELAADKEVFAETKTDLGNGVVIKSRSGDGNVSTVRSETLEKFLLTKYGLNEDSYSPSLKRTIRGFETYHMSMNSRAPVTLDEAAKHQGNWFRIVAGALDGELGDSTVCFDTILYLAARHADDLFNDRLACRGFNLLGDVIRDQFNLYQSIIVNAANPRTRAHYVKNQLNLDAVSRTIRSDNQRRNLLAYLSSVV